MIAEVPAERPREWFEVQRTQMTIATIRIDALSAEAAIAQARELEDEDFTDWEVHTSEFEVVNWGDVDSNL